MNIPLWNLAITHNWEACVAWSPAPRHGDGLCERLFGSDVPPRTTLATDPTARRRRWLAAGPVRRPSSHLLTLKTSGEGGHGTAAGTWRRYLWGTRTQCIPRGACLGRILYWRGLHSVPSRHTPPWKPNRAYRNKQISRHSITKRRQCLWCIMCATGDFSICCTLQIENNGFASLY